MDVVWVAGGVLDASTLNRYAELVRPRVAAGATFDDVLSELRRDGVEKIDCVRVVHQAMDMSMADAKILVHRSPVWADRREGDEYLEDQFWRAAFILCVVQNGQVNQPDELAAECREHQQRATTQLQAIAAELPEVALAGYRQHMAHNHRGTALAALMAAGRQHRVPHGYWQALAAVSGTLCLAESVGDEEPAADDGDFVYAAHVVRRLATAAPDM